MRFFASGLRGVAVCLLLLCTLLVSGNVTLAQTVSTSPLAPAVLAFGVPTGSTVSAEQTVGITVSGGSVTLSAFAISGTTDFTISSNTCPTAAIASGGGCTVGVTFTPTPSLAGMLETATLNFTTTAEGQATVSVPLSGALGAIKLFNELDLGASSASASTSDPFAYGSQPLILSCPAGASAVLSNTPDGKGNVLEDNFIDVAVGSAAATNVCPAGIADPVNDCFTHAYQDYAGGSQHNGTNTDSITNANTITGEGPGGVPPINISSLFTFNAPTPVTFKLYDEGVIVAGSTLFLVTNCTTNGIQSGGTITGNPINPNIPSSLTPVFAFDTNPGNNVVFSADYSSTAGGNGPIANPQVTDVGIPQSQFAALVQGTSAAPAVCLRVTAEVVPGSTPTEYLCKGYLIQCTTATSSTPSGANCPNSPQDVLKFLSKFDSPDAPIPSGPTPSNFLPDGHNATGSACTFYLSQLVPSISGSCAHGTGAGLLEGNDSWASGTYAPCSFTDSSDPLFGQVCPQNPITAFRGAQDPGHGGTTTLGTNSLFLPVVNMPLPTDSATLPGNKSWVNSTGAVNVTFAASPATYSPASNNPPNNNGFTPANIRSETFGYAFWNVAIPDPDGPSTGDTAIANTGNCPSTSTGTFSTIQSLNLTQEGIYNVHHYATDCAGTEGLVYQPTVPQLTDPSANWASFPVAQFGVDKTAPSIGAGACNPTGGVFYTNVTVTCTVTDPGYVAGQSGSGFGSPTNGIQGSPTTTVSLTTNLAAGAYYTGQYASTSQQVCDLAGNCITPLPVGPFTIDLLGQADLAIGAISLPAASVKTGTYITYIMAVTNYGPTAAQGVNITDALPTGATFVSGYTLNGLKIVSCNAAVTCPVGNLNKGATALAYITIKVPTTPGSVVNTIVVGGLNPDPVSKNNSFTVTTKVTK